MSGVKLKLNLNTGVNRTPSIKAPGASALPTPGSAKPKPKIKLAATPKPQSVKPALPAVTSAEPTPVAKKTKAGRASKPSAKIIESRKRTKDELDSDDETISVVPPSKKFKIQLNTSKAAQKPGGLLKIRTTGKPPKRPPGEGYDSEASDGEVDPAIEEEFVLRMVPGDDCEYLRKAIADKKVGLPANMGGADIQMKFFNGDGRRGAVTIRKHMYAATLVDLPCVIEGMKSWDKRGWWKSADICQMLWVFAAVKSEDEAKMIPLPAIINPKTHQYPHGLTPPMFDARKRRFRKRISRDAIEAVEDAVEKLLDADAAAISTRFEMVDPDGRSRQTSRAYSPGASSAGGYEVGTHRYSESEDDDAEGELDEPGYFSIDHNGIMDDSIDADLEADLEAAMQESLDRTTPASTLDVSTPLEMEMPTQIQDEEDDSGDDSLDGGYDEEEEGDSGEIDEDEKARLAQIDGAREDILDLEKQLSSVQERLAMQSNPILRKRLEDNARKLRAELQLKKSATGED